MIMAAALLGISSITGIWKKGSTMEIKSEEIKDKDIENPCDTCIYNK